MRNELATTITKENAPLQQTYYTPKTPRLVDFNSIFLLILKKLVTGHGVN